MLHSGDSASTHTRLPARFIVSRSRGLCLAAAAYVSFQATTPSFKASQHLQTFNMAISCRNFRITAKRVIIMKITVVTVDEHFVTLDIDQEESVENVKALLEVETSVPLHQQQLHFNGKEMRNSDRLSSIGIRDGDLIMMLSLDSGSMANELRINPDGSTSDPISFQQRMRRDSQLIGQLLQSDPELAQAIMGDDLDNLQNILRERHQQKLQLRRKHEEELALMYADPFDVESQRKIEAAIRQVTFNAC
ncbi:Ubiquitin-60S ribosomal protein L40 [Apostasia shenzhenica]|uniref:Ubiquitin-60S ribosomal protein L40 n=1 Tax=Apostasia shenzhenica TaxID=1088818 RepID=A0A2I0AB69_9ASPA|nr:Ubiquitin-60S ribosomal protein L40 [Apostasia shenzhenica]